MNVSVDGVALVEADGSVTVTLRFPSVAFARHAGVPESAFKYAPDWEHQQQQLAKLRELDAAEREARRTQGRRL